MLRNQIKLLMT